MSVSVAWSACWQFFGHLHNVTQNRVVIISSLLTLQLNIFALKFDINVLTHIKDNAPVNCLSFGGLAHVLSEIYRGYMTLTLLHWNNAFFITEIIWTYSSWKHFWATIHPAASGIVSTSFLLVLRWMTGVKVKKNCNLLSIISQNYAQLWL